MFNSVKENLMDRYQNGLPRHLNPDSGFRLTASNGDTFYDIESLFFTTNGIELRAKIGTPHSSDGGVDTTAIGMLITSTYAYEMLADACQVSLLKLEPGKHSVKHFHTYGRSTRSETKAVVEELGWGYRDKRGVLVAHNIAPLVNCLYAALAEVFERFKKNGSV